MDRPQLALPVSSCISNATSESPTREKTAHEKALAAFDAHLASRVPDIISASEALQAVLQERNTIPFPAPGLPVGKSCFGGLRGEEGHGALSYGGKGHAANVANPHGARHASRPLIAGAYAGEGNGVIEYLPGVDKKTGRGLRECLIMHAKAGSGAKKTELQSLSFHDVRPDIRTGAHRNELVAHLEVGVDGWERLAVFEVDV